MIAKEISGSFLWARRAIEEINLNDTVAEAKFTDDPIIKHEVIVGPWNQPPRHVVAVDYRKDRASTEKFYIWVVSSNNRNSRY